MEQLSTLDAGFLAAEDSDRRISLAIGGVAVLEGPPPDFPALLSTLGARVAGCRRFAQKLQLRPFDLGPPGWVDDENFDLAHHVRRAALPQPGDDAELFRFVAEHMAQRLDRDRPLWNIWVIEGLADDRWALLMKVHHCIGDGIATSHILTGLCDNQAAASFAERICPAPHGAPGAAAAPSMSSGPDPLRWVSGLWNTSTALGANAVRAARGAVELSAGLLRPAAATSLNGPMTAQRRFSAARVALDDVRAVCRAFDVTVNDVALAALTEGYRDLLLRRGERPGPDSLRALVPVSIRSAGALNTPDNRVSVMLPYLPVEEQNPVLRLRRVHSRLTRTKRTGQRQAGSVFVSAANHLPFPLASWSVRLLTQLPQRSVTTLATNVPGPAETLRMLGRRVIEVWPVPPIALQLRTGAAILSYADQLSFGVLADFDSMPDVEDFTGSIETSVATLLACSKRRKTAGRRRGPTLVATG